MLFDEQLSLMTDDRNDFQQIPQILGTIADVCL
jgi:hypothetical protein